MEWDGYLFFFLVFDTYHYFPGGCVLCSGSSGECESGLMSLCIEFWIFHNGGIFVWLVGWFRVCGVWIRNWNKRCKWRWNIVRILSGVFSSGVSLFMISISVFVLEICIVCSISLFSIYFIITYVFIYHHSLSITLCFI